MGAAPDRTSHVQGSGAAGLSGREPGPWSPAPLVSFSIALHLGALAALAARPRLWKHVLALLAADHAVLGAAGMLPRSPLLGPNLSRLPETPSTAGCVALTFDDGPDPAITPRILDILDQHGATASFFCIGERAADHPSVVREIVGRGHSVENHTHRHSFAFSCLPPAAMAGEIRTAQETIGAIVGMAPRFFRAPAGLRSPLLDPILARHGLAYVSWTRRGYDGVSRDSEAVLGRLLRGLAARDVLLLHDGRRRPERPGGPPVLAVLPALLAHLRACGLRGVSLPAALGDADQVPSA